MLFKISAYLRFLIGSHNQYGIHSPFVYDFITKCLYNRATKSEFQRLQNYLTERYLLENLTLSTEQTKLLIQIIGYFNPDWLLNFSREKGFIAKALSLNNKQEVFQIDGYCTSKTDAPNLIKTGYDEFLSVSEEYHRTFLSLHKKPFCLVFLNENHLQKGLKECLETTLGAFSTRSIFIIKGVHNSKEKEALWEKIKTIEQVSVTVDLFFWGIIFLRKGQAKQHFKIRV